MAISFVLFLGLLSTTVRAQCNLTTWSEWGSCQNAWTSTGHSLDAISKMSRFDGGRFVHAKIMALKNEEISKPVHEHTDSRTHGPVKCQNVCELYPEHGPCTTSVWSWYHNARSRSCKQFVYGGCEGNGNRFNTKHECETVCSDYRPGTFGNAGPFPCHNVDQISFINLTDLGYDYTVTNDYEPRVNDIWGWFDTDYQEEYVIVGATGGSSFVRVTDPEHPHVLGFLYSVDNAVSIWRDMKVVNDHVYIVADTVPAHYSNHGMQVFDLKTLRGLDTDPKRVFQATMHYDKFGNAHNVVSNPETNTIYVVGSHSYDNYTNPCAGGLYMLDVTKPTEPEFLGCYGDDGYTHDAQCVVYHGPDNRYKGNEICFCFNEDTLTILDVTDKNNIEIVGKVGYDGAQYTHQGWCSEDMSLLVLDDEYDEYRARNRPDTSEEEIHTKTMIWDINNLKVPILQNVYHSTQQSIDHNQYVHGDYTYQSNYKAGFRLLKILHEDFNLREVGYFDVHPTETRATFAGTWSNYPFLKSGAVAVTSIEYGLFLLKPNWANIEKYPQTYGVSQRTRSNQGYNIHDASPYDVDVACAGLEEFKAC